MCVALSGSVSCQTHAISALNDFFSGGGLQVIDEGTGAEKTAGSSGDVEGREHQSPKAVVGGPERPRDEATAKNVDRTVDPIGGGDRRRMDLANKVVLAVGDADGCPGIPDDVEGRFHVWSCGGAEEERIHHVGCD